MGKTFSISNFKRIPSAFLAAMAAIVLFYCAEIFLLPLSFYSFRLEQVFVVKKFLSGQFYPNLKITFQEDGDLAYDRKYAVRKKIEFQTDAYGYRKQDNNVARHEIVIIGDSNVAGFSLTQQDILSEVLERRLGKSVYPFTREARPPVDLFLSTQRFINAPPEVVIVESIERYIPELYATGPVNYSRKHRYVYLFLDSHPVFSTLLDRVYKNHLVRYLKNRIEALMSHHVVREDGGTMLFGARTATEIGSGQEVSSQRIEEIADIVVSYDRLFKERGIRFLFLPIPNKENIYSERLPVKSKAKPLFLKKLISTLQNKGIEVIDTQTAYDEAVLRNEFLLYHVDDTHWNANGVKVATDLIEKALLIDRHAQ